MRRSRGGGLQRSIAMTAAGRFVAARDHRLRLALVMIGEHLRWKIGAAAGHLGRCLRLGGASGRASGVLTRLAHQDGEQPLDRLERAIGGPAERAMRPQSAPLLFERLFVKRSRGATLDQGLFESYWPTCKRLP
jgi:hypothetical protein